MSSKEDSNLTNWNMFSKEDSSLTDWKIVTINLLAQNTIIPFLQSYGVNDEYCSICRCNFNENSLNNKSKLKKDNLAIGKCGHCFHKSCIENWLREQPTCPICAKKWEYLIIDDISGIKEKLIPTSPITNSSLTSENQSEQKIDDSANISVEDIEEKIDEFEVSWSQNQSSGWQESEQIQEQTSQELPGWGSEVETDTDDDMPPLVE